MQVFLTVALLAVLVAIVAGFVELGASLLRRVQVSRRIINIAAATFAASIAFSASYWFLFETGTCGGRGSFACIINENDGMMGFTGVIVSLIAIWVAILTDERSKREDRQRAIRAYSASVKRAAEEIVHNLGHIAVDNYDEFLDMPQLSTTKLQLLSAARDSDEDGLDEKTWRAVDAVVRDIEKARTALLEDPGSREWVKYLEMQTRASLDALFGLWRFNKDLGYKSHEVNRQFQRLDRLTQRSTAPYRVCFRTSELRDEAYVRATQIPVLCWSNDAILDGIEVVELAPLFAVWASP